MAKPNPFTRSIRVKLIVGTVAIVLAVVCILTFVIARNAAHLLGKASHDQLAQLLQQTGRMDEAKREFAIAERLQGDNKD